MLRTSASDVSEDLTTHDITDYFEASGVALAQHLLAIPGSDALSFSYCYEMRLYIFIHQSYLE